MGESSASGPGAARKRRLVLGAKALISLGIVAFVLARADLSVIARYLASARPLPALAALLAVLAQWPLTARRWQVISASLGIGMSLPKALTIQLGAQFMSQAVPTLGGDAWRVVSVKRAGYPLRHGVESVLIDRIAAVGGVVSVSAAALPWILPRIGAGSWRPLLYAVLASSTAALLAALSIDRWLPALPNRPMWQRVRELASSAGRARSVLFRPRPGAVVWACSLAVPVLSGIAVWWAAQAFQVSLGLLDSVALVPSITLLAALPASIAGWGVREASAVALLSLVGATLEQALLLSATLGALQLVVAIPGAALLGLSELERKEEA